VEVAAANALGAALAARARALRDAGATSLLVDATQNGGGSDWVEVAARTLAAVRLRGPRLAFVRSPHWTGDLRERLASVEKDLRDGGTPRATLERAAETLRAAIAASEERCDASAVWTGGAMPCSMLGAGFLTASGVLPYARPGSFAGLGSRTTLFHPVRYAYTEGAVRLPLRVAVDRETWSAAEYFAALLRDNGAATIVGEPTGGAGCGYTNGGIPAVLARSGARVRMADCARLRADGTNEVAGIVPDVLVPWSAHDSASQRAAKLAHALGRAAPSTSRPRSR
jgi:Peptidase family S41